MQIQPINPKNFKSSELDKAVEILKSGGIIVYPTETSYGLGGNFLSERAVKKIYKIKHRRSGALLPVIVASLSSAKKLVRFNAKALDLAKRFWPGPVTLVLGVKKNLHAKSQRQEFRFLKDYQDLALRVSSNMIAQVLAKKLKQPLISTSANISDKGSCYSADEVIAQFSNQSEQPDLILDAGRLPQVKPSTIIRLVDGRVEVLRSGPVKMKYK